MPLISVAGVMGVGKSTVAAKLAEVFDCQLIEEQHETHCREAFFHEPEKWALAHQCEYVLRNGENFTVALSTDAFLRDRSRAGLVACVPTKYPSLFVSDCLLSLSGAYSGHTMRSLDFLVFTEMYMRLAGTAWRPDLIIYLTRSAEGTLQRIRQRDRSSEGKVTLEFLEDIGKRIELIVDNHRSSTFSQKRVPVARFEGLEDKNFTIDQIAEMVEFCKTHEFGVEKSEGGAQ